MDIPIHADLIGYGGGGGRLNFIIEIAAEMVHGVGGREKGSAKRDQISFCQVLYIYLLHTKKYAEIKLLFEIKLKC